jgi:Cysteine-rich secretory protein family
VTPRKPYHFLLLVWLCLLIAPSPLPAIFMQNPGSPYIIHLPLLMKEFQPPSSLPGWLSYVNYYRATAGLPPVSEKPEWSAGDLLHARYMVRNDVIEHDEDPGNPWYTPEGRAAAQNSNLIISLEVQATDEWAIDGFMQAPFHALGIIDPRLLQVGYGSYREADGQFEMAAGLDVIRGMGAAAQTLYPVFWPGNGVLVPLYSYWGEHPDPLSSCPGYSAPSGLPLILQLGAGTLTPVVSASSLTINGQSLEHCVFDETSYANGDLVQQNLGRNILNARDAVILIPRQPLTPGSTYSASITANGQIYAWSFSISVRAGESGSRFLPGFVK